MMSPIGNVHQAFKCSNTFSHGPALVIYLVTNGGEKETQREREREGNPDALAFLPQESTLGLLRSAHTLPLEDLGCHCEQATVTGL